LQIEHDRFKEPRRHVAQQLQQFRLGRLPQLLQRRLRLLWA
jgi:hypothetical protein